MDNLKAKAYDLRKDTLDIIMAGKGGHIGGDMSIMEILVSLYFNQMNISKDNLDDENRDYFILSKGHAVEAYYAVLCAKGILDLEDVKKNFSKFGSKYIGHPNNKLPGIEMNSGSLGHGLPVGVGIAYGNLMNGRLNRTYVLMGDGELAEGSVWEGFMAGGMYKLDNLCAIIDRNRLQISGCTEDVMAHEVLEDRIKSFGWYVIQADGNDLDAMDAAFEMAKGNKGAPTCIIANTIKGCGSAVMENKANWHHKVPTAEEYEQIVKDFNQRKAAYQS